MRLLPAFLFLALLWFVFALLPGCATMPQYGQAFDGDTACGLVGPVTVRLRPGAFQSCDEARTMVSDALLVVPLNSAWTVIFSAAEPAGWDIGSDMGVHFFNGMVHPSRVIALSGNSSDLLAHEFGHAQDIEEHRPNRRDPW